MKRYAIPVNTIWPQCVNGNPQVYLASDVEAELAKKDGLIKEQYGTIETLQEQRDAAWAWKKEYETELAKKDEEIDERQKGERDLRGAKIHLTNLSMRLREELANIKETCVNEIEELQKLFDLQQIRMGEAVALWREATGQHDVLPDLGDLLTWLMEERVRLRKALKKIRIGTMDELVYLVAIEALEQKSP